MDIRPFSIDIPRSILQDLKTRLSNTRWPDEVTGSGWDYGTSRAYLQDLVAYWQTRFDWYAAQHALNTFSHFRATVKGQSIHFLHERGKGSNPLPLILTHGWPGTFVEMLKIIPLLTDPASHGADPADSFDVVVPSLPGYGFSDRPHLSGPWNVHDLWTELMIGLGYERFGAYGSDFGASVTTDLGWRYPEHVLGIHLTTASDIAWPYPLPDPSDLSPAEKAFLVRMEQWDQEEGGYRHLHRTRPQTLAYGLADSPAGLAGWLIEKFRAWSDCDGVLERRFSQDELLTIVTLYWVTETINSSMRDYYERRHHPQLWQQPRMITVPTAVALFPKDFVLPQEWVKRTYNVQRWAELSQGAHFPAWEEPQLLVEEIRAFFRTLR